MSNEYVAGLLFTQDYNWVLLVIKNRPIRQKGKYNAIGGKIEPNETPYQAMVREFEEEAGLHIETWEKFCRLEGDNFQVHFYTTTYPSITIPAKTMTDEQIILHTTVYTPKDAVSNLSWLIQMAQSKSKQDWPYLVVEKAGKKCCHVVYESLVSKNKL